MMKGKFSPFTWISEAIIRKRMMYAHASIIVNLYNEISVLYMGYRWITAFVIGRIEKLPEEKHPRIFNSAIHIGGWCRASICGIAYVIKLVDDGKFKNVDDYKSRFDYEYRFIADHVSDTIIILKNFFIENEAEIQSILSSEDAIFAADPLTGITFKDISNSIVNDYIPGSRSIGLVKFANASKYIEHVVDMDELQ